MIDVEQTGEGDPKRFEVTVTKGPSESHHEVTLASEDHERIAPDATGSELVEASFTFLLEREPKESILPSFDLTVINRYFPDYEDKIEGYL